MVPVGLLTARATGEFSFLPSSGGVNHYLGNHPDQTKLATAFDFEWDQLNRMPLGAGLHRPYEQQRWFYSQTRAYWGEDPAGFVGRLGLKAVQFVSSREIPRNGSVYVARQWSTLLSLLVWKVDGFGFPFGLLLPLAAIGLVGRWREVPVPFTLFLVLYPAAIVSVFVTARYRIPVIPALCILAGAGIVTLAEAVRNRRYRRLAAAGAGSLGLVVLATVPGPFPLERVDFHALLYENVARTLELEGTPEAARAWYEEALRLNPDSHVAHTQLGQQLRHQGRLWEALPHYERALQRRPDVAATHLNSGVALIERGRREEGLVALRRAVTVDPN